ncbi:MAG TPA: histidinol-phosphatase [Rhodospirillales bacterium]|jgi:inositol-phosphate phosphatase/L-galactose 1-phosphate phosphatase/histidinol-phosphatase|nr:histidinol-phosphatase [Rhodospirillales bacterium]
MPVPLSYIELAEKLADIARPIVTNYFRSDIKILDKENLTPVTAADREAETAIRIVLESECPKHGILGEEFGSHNLDAEYVWIIDPIDGTKAFVTGKPLFGTLIALCKNGSPVLGIIDQPILKERWIGAIGHPTTHNGNLISTRACKRIGDAWLSATSPDMFKGKHETAFKQLAGKVKFPLYGGDCYSYGLLASGFSDIICEATMQPYDYCALVPIIEGAGGKISNWAGEPLKISSDGTVLATGDAILHEIAIEILSQQLI